MSGSTWNTLPWKFEAGTPHIAGVIGLGAAIGYLAEIGMETICDQERVLLECATETLQAIPGLRLIGTAADKAAIVSFVLEGVHPHDLGTVVDHEGVAIRAGHHCAMPVMEHFGLPATARASFAFYNTVEEVEQLAQAVRKCQKMLG